MIRIVPLVVYPLCLRIVSTMRIGLPMVISALEEKPLVRHAAVPSGPAAIVRGPISTLPSTPKRNLVDARSLVEAIDVNWTGKRSNCQLGASKTPQRQSRSAAKAQQRRRKGAAKALQRRRRGAAKALPRRRKDAAKALQRRCQGAAKAPQRRCKGAAKALQRRRQGAAKAPQKRNKGAAKRRKSAAKAQQRA